MQNSDPTSTRKQTRQHGVFVRSSPGIQSLDRGMQLLRAFLGGATHLTNAELAERCALPRSTVSRLTRTLVDNRFLEYDAKQSVYRLAPVFLSFGACYHQGHTDMAAVLPLVQDTAEREAVNISLAVRDGVHMVYLASFRYDQGPIQRVVNTGFRVPIEHFASGHALIAASPPKAQEQLFEQLGVLHGRDWPAQLKRIELSIAQYQTHGFCTLDSVPGLAAVATALRTADDSLCALVVTATRPANAHTAPTRDLPGLLQSLTQAMQARWGHA